MSHKSISSQKIRMIAGMKKTAHVASVGKFAEVKILFRKLSGAVAFVISTIDALQSNAK